MQARVAIASTNRRTRAVWGGIFVAAVVVWGIAASWPISVFVASLVMACTTALMLLQAPPKRGTSTNVVEADESGLVVDGKRRFERKEILRAYAGRSHDDRETVHIEATKHRATTLFVSSAKEGQEIVAALALPQNEGVTELRAHPPWAKKLRHLMLVLMLPGFSLIQFVNLLPVWGAYALTTLYLAALVPLVFAQRVSVGDDGVSLTWLGHRRFMPFRRILAATASPFGIDLVLDGGRVVEVRLTQQEGRMPPERALLLERIKAGVARHQELTPAEEESLLARRGRDLETWLGELRALGEETTAGYRGLAVPRDRLWAIVESPSADPSAREGAALALHASLDESGRARLASLAHTSASPRLRVALDAVSTAADQAKLRVALDGAEAIEEEPLSSGMPAARKARAIDS